jgi:hypothetical protein
MIVRRLITAFSLAALATTLGASAALAQPSPSCVAQITHGLNAPGEAQRDQHMRAFGLEISRVAQWPRSSLAECLEAIH